MFRGVLAAAAAFVACAPVSAATYVVEETIPENRVSLTDTFDPITLTIGDTLDLRVRFADPVKSYGGTASIRLAHDGPFGSEYARNSVTALYELIEAFGTINTSGSADGSDPKLPVLTFSIGDPPAQGGFSGIRFLVTLNEGPDATLSYFDIVAGAVPEPATWAMMIAGFGLAGATVRQRRSSKRQAT